METATEKAVKTAAKFVSPREAAEILCAHPNTLRRWARKGALLHYVTEGGHYRYDVATFLAQQGLRAA